MFNADEYKFLLNRNILSKNAPTIDRPLQKPVCSVKVFPDISHQAFAPTNLQVKSPRTKDANALSVPYKRTQTAALRHLLRLYIGCRSRRGAAVDEGRHLVYCVAPFLLRHPIAIAIYSCRSRQAALDERLSFSLVYCGSSTLGIAAIYIAAVDKLLRCRCGAAACRGK